MSSTLKPNTESICPGEVQTPSNAIISKCTKPFNISYISFPGEIFNPPIFGSQSVVSSCYILFHPLWNHGIATSPALLWRGMFRAADSSPAWKEGKRRTVTCGGIKPSLVSTDLFHSILLKKHDRRTSKRSNVGKIWWNGLGSDSHEMQELVDIHFWENSGKPIHDTIKWHNHPCQRWRFVASKTRPTNPTTNNSNFGKKTWSETTHQIHSDTWRFPGVTPKSYIFPL